MAEIITIGEIVAEIVATEKEQKFDTTGYFLGPFPSGAPAIFIDQAAKCGSKTTIFSAVGNDGFGKMNLTRLRNDGVDISNIKTLNNESTGVAFVTYQEDGNRDFLYHIGNAACGSLTESDIDEKEFRDCKYLHIMGSSIYNEGSYRAICKGIEFANKYGTKISFDPNVRKEIVNDVIKHNRLVDILKQSNILLAGDSELLYLLGEDEMLGIETMLNYGTEIVIIKRGSKGASLYTKKTTLHAEPYRVEEVDPTGAGDCFGGTFISCINQGVDLEDALRFSTIAGALAVTKKGPMEGNSSLAELKKIAASTSSV